MSVIQLLASGNFITVSKPLARAVGLDEAVMIGELASEHTYWESRGSLEDGFFYSTVENVEENTTLSDYRQRKALKTLQDMGVIEVKRMGLPAKRYVRINEERLADLLEDKFLKNQRTVSLETEELEGPNFEVNNNRGNDNKNNNRSNRGRHRYGEYRNVLLSDEELSKLQSEFPDWQDRIERLSEYMASTGKTYRNHLATIRAWDRRSKREKGKDLKQSDPAEFGWTTFDMFKEQP